MKVIFLDIDGVLNSNDWYVKTRGVGGYNGGDIDPECIELINDLIDATGAKIIMCEQLSYYFGKEKVELEKERKLERLKERLSKYTD